MGARLAIALAGLVGCGSSTVDEVATGGPWQSGSRMRAVVAQAGDGFRIVRGWRDVELGLDCENSAQGTLCGVVLANDGDFFFSDRDCTAKVVLLDAGARSQGYAHRMEDDGLHLYRIPVQPLAPTGAVAFVKDAVGCATVDGLEGLHPVIEEIDSDELVQWRDARGFEVGDSASATDDGALDVHALVDAVRETDDADTRLRLTFDRRGDLRGAPGVYDSDLDRNCRVFETTAGLRCVPRATLFFLQPMYEDAACQTPVRASPEPGIGLVNRAGVIERVDAYETEVDPLYAPVDGVCMLQAASYTPVEIPLEDLEPLELVTE